MLLLIFVSERMDSWVLTVKAKHIRRKFETLNWISQCHVTFSGVLVSSRASEAKPRRHSHQVWERESFHFLHRLCSVIFYCVLADAKFSTDLLV
jgi:hypothetical protein